MISIIDVNVVVTRGGEKSSVYKSYHVLRPEIKRTFKSTYPVKSTLSHENFLRDKDEDGGRTFWTYGRHRHSRLAARGSRHSSASKLFCSSFNTRSSERLKDTTRYFIDFHFIDYRS
jgi:hypothetical protein